ncbi:MAG: hypothetical protein LC108_03075 [Anaerolineales bacterium]|nr:hypothetical protein [Anaerolineales bacterium]
MSRDKLFKAFHNLYWPIIIFITLLVCKFYLNGLQWEEPRLALSQLMDGTAYKPFVYRILVPTITKIAILVFPLPATLYASILIFAFLLGFIVCIRSFSSIFWKKAEINDFVGALSIPMLTPFMLTNRHVYDFSTLFLFSAGLMLMAQKKWGYFLIVYTLACLNKETTLFLSLIFLYYFRQNFKKPIYWKLLFFQAIIYTSIRALIMWRFSNNPGVMMENHFYDHFSSALVPSPKLILGYVSYLILMIIAVRTRWKEKPVFLREALSILAPLMFVLYLLGSYPFEIRTFYEIYPLLILLASPILGRLIGLDFFKEQFNCSSSLP